MKQENRLMDLLGMLPDRILEEAAETEDQQKYRQLALREQERVRQKRRQMWKQYSTLAACLCILIVAAVLVQRGILFPNKDMQETTSAFRESIGANTENMAPTAAGSAAESKAAVYYQGKMFVWAETAETLPEAYTELGILYYVNENDLEENFSDILIKEHLVTMDAALESKVVYAVWEEAREEEITVLYILVDGQYLKYVPQ